MSSPSLDSLLHFAGGGNPPLRVEVVLTPSDEVLSLKAKIADLEKQLADLDALYRKVEFRYRCELLINLQTADFCKLHGLDVPSRLKDHPYSDEVSLLDQIKSLRDEAANG